MERILRVLHPSRQFNLQQVVSVFRGNAEKLFVHQNARIKYLSHLVNQITGYDTCQELKHRVIIADQQLTSLKAALGNSRKAYNQAVALRSSCQKDLNSLLQSKPSWRTDDLIRFTELYKQEMELEKSEHQAKIENDSLEIQVDDAHQKFLDALRERYQGEQLWADKIRQLSSYGTFGLIIFNTIMFILFQLFLEPRRRTRNFSDIKTIIEPELHCIRNEIHDLRSKFPPTGFESTAIPHQHKLSQSEKILIALTSSLFMKSILQYII